MWLAHRLGLSRCVASLHALPCVPAHSDPMSSSNHGYWSLSHRRTRGEKKSRMRNCSEMTSNASRKSASGCIFLCVLLSWGTITSHTLRDSPGGFRASVDLKKPSRLLRTQWAHHPGEKAEQTRTRRPGRVPPPIRQLSSNTVTSRSSLLLVVVLRYLLWCIIACIIQFIACKLKLTTS